VAVPGGNKGTPLPDRCAVAQDQLGNPWRLGADPQDADPQARGGDDPDQPQARRTGESSTGRPVPDQRGTEGRPARPLCFSCSSLVFVLLSPLRVRSFRSALFFFFGFRPPTSLREGGGGGGGPPYPFPFPVGRAAQSRDGGS